MNVEYLSEGVCFVVVSKEPELRQELEKLNETVGHRGDYDVVLDFTRVEIVTSSSMSNLLILQDFLRQHGHKLVLCGVSLPTRGALNVAGLDRVFQFADDKFDGLACLQTAHNP